MTKWILISAKPAWSGLMIVITIYYMNYSDYWAFYIVYVQSGALQNRAFILEYQLAPDMKYMHAVCKLARNLGVSVQNCMHLLVTKWVPSVGEEGALEDGSSQYYSIICRAEAGDVYSISSITCPIYIAQLGIIAEESFLFKSDSKEKCVF